MTDLSTGAGAAYGDRDPDALARRAGERAKPRPRPAAFSSTTACSIGFPGTSRTTPTRATS